MAYVVYTAGGSGEEVISGEIEIEGKEGKTKVPFEQRIPVVESGGSLAAPELQVLYAGGYKNVIVPSMAGGEVTSLKATGAGASARPGSKKGEWYVTVPQTSGQKVKITWTGKANGADITKSFGPELYTILKAPTPKVLTKEARKGSKTMINCSLDPSNPLRNKFKYKCVGGTITMVLCKNLFQVVQYQQIL